VHELNKGFRRRSFKVTSPKSVNNKKQPLMDLLRKL
jgi:hypothetical protein